VIDLATRMVVGWQTAEHLRTSLVIDALAMARRHGHAQPGAVFHADREALNEQLLCLQSNGVATTG
jgi:putative transposase